MARNPDAIERDIERARSALAATIDQLSVKANPQRLADNAKTSVQAKLEEPKVKFPLIGAGALVAALLIRKLVR
ncbi:DUF3618 domain-containing protein [Prauserella rugosa]|uniref:Uncharacterized protein DUF3618 n=1 Tax=Prauserella rugosa TaxID=43354 RepID=A0A660CBK8_9PSEU|nr:DUF3618 domain-containing protein [Prauserella rugosa]KID28125.1 Protein of unknown function (DUF3618) [Prauserella sp. Am3]KMS85394.1 cell division protein DivIC (FtsB), stabilizes FtsL against RasP cleavage [Streptomyces regensis]TWH18205.1 uncharacterized protein DUF3618 [Prauserella rugosa]